MLIDIGDFSCFSDLALSSPADYYIEVQGSLIQYVYFFSYENKSYMHNMRTIMANFTCDLSSSIPLAAS